MTTKPELNDPDRWWPGIAALALFGVMAYVFATASFGQGQGFPNGAEITAGIGYAMFNINAQNAVPSEGFLVAFEIIDLVLVGALVGAVMLARREEAGEIVSALRSGAVEEEGPSVATDGGEPKRIEGERRQTKSDGSERTVGSRTSSDTSDGSKEEDR